MTEIVSPSFLFSLPEPGAEGETDAEADGHKAVQEGEPPGPGLRAGDVRHVGVGRQVEAGGATRQVLEALQQQVLHLDLKFVQWYISKIYNKVHNIEVSGTNQFTIFFS